MKRKWVSALLIVAAAVGLSACSCDHQWKDATCQEPKTCELCGETTGDILAHDYVPATCTEPETCKICGETEGEPRGHDYQEANCTTPETCSICGGTKGEAPGHDFEKATCTKPETCKFCGEIQGEAPGHDYVEATCTSAKYCKVCNEREGNPVGHDFTKATYEAPATCKNCGETTGEVLQLSSACDKVLASGTGKDGGVYELVANEKETYAGMQVEIGIIKDNRWVLEPTSDSPFVDEDGTIFGRATSIHEESTYNLDCVYLGNGCFLCIAPEKSLIYNADTKQHYLKEYMDYSNYSSGDRYDHPCLTGYCLRGSYAGWEHSHNQKETNLLNKENSILIIDADKWENVSYIELLDTNTMQMSKLTIETGYSGGIRDVYPFSEGVFAACRGRSSLEFYDKNGNKVMEPGLSLYASTLQTIFFKDGKCSAYVENENGTVYLVSIDHDGKVISSQEVNPETIKFD